ncbi:hypothetical protein MKW98_008151, partial [Papaver atlanticum]
LTVGFPSQDTFRGRVCECPLVQGVQFKGDRYSSCEASGRGCCNINNEGCWHETRDGIPFLLVWILMVLNASVHRHS